jgi:hypothetical protein
MQPSAGFLEMHLKDASQDSKAMPFADFDSGALHWLGVLTVPTTRFSFELQGFGFHLLI